MEAYSTDLSILIKILKEKWKDIYYLEIFGRKFCGEKGNFGLWIMEKELFFWEWKH
jgi:hypothetical protein